MPTFPIRVNVEYSQYCLMPLNADLGTPPYAGGNGLVWVNSETGAVVVMTGLDNGHLPLTAIVLDSEPPVELDPWDDMVEVSVTVTGGGFAVGGPTELEELGEIELPAQETETQTYRMRVQVRGRDKGHEIGYVDAEAGEEMVEQHQILIWRSAAAPEQALKLTDKVGAEIRDR